MIGAVLGARDGDVRAFVAEPQFVQGLAPGAFPAGGVCVAELGEAGLTVPVWAIVGLPASWAVHHPAGGRGVSPRSSGVTMGVCSPKAADHADCMASEAFLMTPISRGRP